MLLETICSAKERMPIAVCSKDQMCLFKRPNSQACAVAVLTGIQTTMPRVVSQQIFRASFESNTSF